MADFHVQLLTAGCGVHMLLTTPIKNVSEVLLFSLPLSSLLQSKHFQVKRTNVQYFCHSSRIIVKDLYPAVRL